MHINCLYFGKNKGVYALIFTNFGFLKSQNKGISSVYILSFLRGRYDTGPRPKVEYARGLRHAKPTTLFDLP